MAPGDSINCGEDTGWFSSWTMPGCEEPDSIATQVIQNSLIEPWVQDAKRGVADSTKTMFTFWQDVPDPAVVDQNGVTADVITFLQNQLLWIGAVVMCFIMAIQVVRMMIEMNNGPVKLVASMIFTYMATVAMAVPTIAFGLLVTNFVANTILEKSTEGTSFADNFFSLFNNAVGITSGLLLCILLIIGMLVACFQVVLMLGRSGALFITTGLLVFGAASSGTESGKQAFKTQVGWIAGLIIYKMIAAAVYGVGFRFLGTDTSATGNGLLQIIYGITILAMAVLALPATMRLTAPATAPASGGSGPGGMVTSAAPMVVMAGIRK